MTLRTRLLVSSLAIVVPLSAALLAIDSRLRSADMSDRLDQFTRAEVASGVRDRCLDNDGLVPQFVGLGRLGGRGSGGFPPDDPEGRGRGGRGGRVNPPLGGPPPGGPMRGGRAGGGSAGGREGAPYQLTSYASDFAPPRPTIPEMRPELKEALAKGDIATLPYADDTGRGLERAERISQTAGPCAILVIRVPARPGERRDQLIALLLVVVSVIVAAWATAGPVIGRLRRLEADVHRSADTKYEEPVSASGGDEIASLAVAFNQAGARVRKYLEELEAREVALREFVANTAHDVGLPLTVLQGHLFAIERGAGASPDTMTQVQAAVREAHYLGSLIRNLNAATRLDATNSPIARHDVDLNALIERVVARHRQIAMTTGVSLEFAVPEQRLSVSSEVTLLEQAVSNLVDNAIRYNRSGGHVAVVLDRVSGGMPSGFVLRVTDDGPGVASEELGRLSERRFRSDSARTRRPDGQGIGLAITAEALSRLGFSLKFSAGAESGLVAQIRGG